LFVDESGDFKDPDAEVAVAGVWMQTYDSAQMRLRLERALRQVVPVGPYPPHANRLRYPGWLALASMVEVADNERGAAIRKRAAPAVRAIQSSAEAAAQQGRDAVRACAESGKEIPWEVAREVDEWLQQIEERSHRALKWAVRDMDGAFVQLLSHLQTDVLDGGRCCVAGAWEGREAGPPSDEAPDRYVALLEALIERVFTIAADRKPPMQLVHAHVATRWVTRPGVPRGEDPASKALRTRDITEAFRQAAGFPVGCKPAHVQFFPHPPASYDRTVHPGIVLADFVANRLRGRVLHGTPTWSDVTQRAGHAVGMAVDVRPRLARNVEAPSLAAQGQPREVVRSAFEGQSPAGSAAQAPPWANDQARVWVDLAGQIRDEAPEVSR